MILVQNLLQQLSGSKYIFIIGLFIFSCSPSKKKIDMSNNGKPKKEIPAKTTPKLDTVVWKNDLPSKETTPSSKVESKPTKPSEKPPVITKKYIKEDSIYRIVSLLPLKTDELDTTISKIPSSNIRFIHFYAGMKMAIEERNYDGGRKIVLDIFDTQSNDISANLLSKFNNRPPHLIIGPYKAESLKFAADWAKSHETSLISPWVSSSSITEKNPYYIQIKAGLTSQYKVINNHVRNNFSASNIVLVSKSADDSKSKYFNDTTQFTEKIDEKIIKEEDLASTQLNVLTPYIKTNGPTVFILPLASIKDENYIYHFLRRVSLEKGTNDVYVYGMHKWLELQTEIVEFLSIQKIRLSISNFVDSDNQEVRSFKKKYYNKYREFPSEEALEGYDLMNYCIRSLHSYGHDFQLSNANSISSGLQSSFQLIPVSKSTDKQNVDYFENAYIRIVEIRNNKYRILD